MLQNNKNKYKSKFSGFFVRFLSIFAFYLRIPFDKESKVKDTCAKLNSNYQITGEEAVEKLNLNVGDKVIFDKVLAIIAENSNVIGKPHVEGASVDAKIIEQYRGEKVTIIKFKRRKHYKKKQGHRQNYTRVEILEIKDK